MGNIPIDYVSCVIYKMLEMNNCHLFECTNVNLED